MQLKMKSPILIVLFLVFGRNEACPHFCNCVGDTVTCKNRNLNTVPAFRIGDFAGVRLLDMSGNNLTNLPANAFRNAGLEILLLNNNNLRTIDDDAFKGLENQVKYIDLSNNRLLNLPTALGKFVNLKTLNVSNNYIGHNVLELTESVLRALGDTLTEFVFGSIEQREWPGEVTRHLQDLHRLEVTGLHRSLLTLPPNAFHSFETTLTELSIHHTNLLVVPLAISNLRNLVTLNFDYNLNTGDQGMLIQSFPTSSNSKLTTLSLKGNGLTIFPAVLKYLKKMVKFTIDDNPLDFLNEESIQNLNTLRELEIRNCSLDRIPASLSVIPYLTSIDISFNEIKTIERRDLDGFVNITTLKLTNLPLKYISENAFEPLTNIQEINMNNTQLTEVPLALNLTNSLTTVSIGNTQLDCMCENLVWLLYKQVGCHPKAHHRFTVVGDCDTIHSTVENYMTQYVPLCPGYKEKCGIGPYGK